jgi:hypothetical protein
MARNRQGVTTSPSIEELKAFAQLIVSNVRADMGANRINRLAVTFARNMPTHTDYLRRLGGCASHIAKTHGVKPNKVQHQLFGTVNSYPAWVWDIAAEGFTA